MNRDQYFTAFKFKVHQEISLLLMEENALNMKTKSLDAFTLMTDKSLLPQSNC